MTLAFVGSCSSLALSADEAAFMRSSQPWGLILFKRNVAAPEQVLRLTESFRDLVGRADAPVFVDQEGGRVQRMGPPHWPAYPAAAVYDRLAGDPATKASLIRLATRLIAADLAAVGISVDCLPVLDVPVQGAHGVIGERAYADDPATVGLFGRSAAEGLLAGAVLPVIKHAPGHGRARVDSHVELPTVDCARQLLETTDFVPFRMLRDMPIAMTAHVVYTAIDAQAPATTSKIVVEDIIRGHIGFEGLLISDDLSMQALAGGLRERAVAAFAAGLDVVLHCNGSLSEAEAVASAAPELAGAAQTRAEAALARIARQAEPIDLVEGRAKLAAALALAA
jgi:beta-N-acetylhexosaminidase